MTVVYRSDGAAISNAVMDDNFEQISNRYSGSDTASVTALTLATGYSYFTISGNTDITSIADVSIGFRATFRFTEAGGAIGHSTALIMPGATTITWRAGDTAVFVNTAAGVWRCVSYVRGDISPMGAITQTDGDNSTLAASTEYVDGKTLNLTWSLHAQYTANNTSTTLGETTSIPSDVKAIRVLINNCTVGTTDASWAIRIRLGAGSYPAAPVNGLTGQINTTQFTIGSGCFMTDLGVGDTSDDLTGQAEFWLMEGTNIWVFSSTCTDTNGVEFFVSQGNLDAGGTVDRAIIDVGSTGTENFGSGTAEIWILN